MAKEPFLIRAKQIDSSGNVIGDGLVPEGFLKPILRQSVLTYHQRKRARRVWGRIDGRKTFPKTSRDQWVEDFANERNVDRELAIWERYADVADRVVVPGVKLSRGSVVLFLCGLVGGAVAMDVFRWRLGVSPEQAEQIKQAYKDVGGDFDRDMVTFKADDPQGVSGAGSSGGAEFQDIDGNRKVPPTEEEGGDRAKG